jgi:hypothetical protein
MITLSQEVLMRQSWNYWRRRVSVRSGDLFETIAELRKKSPHAPIPETVFPSPYLLSQAEEKVIDDILAVLNQHGMDSKQSLELLEQIGRIIEMGARMTRLNTYLNEA